MKHCTCVDYAGEPGCPVHTRRPSCLGVILSIVVLFGGVVLITLTAGMLFPNVERGWLALVIALAVVALVTDGVWKKVQ
jgi:hypothetical protein